MEPICEGCDKALDEHFVLVVVIDGANSEFVMCNPDEWLDSLAQVEQFR